MSDQFRPLSMEQLTDWVFDELEGKDALFGVPRSAFFVPDPGHRFRTSKYGVELDTPFGVAAGPHTQMAQNIIVSWLVGARLIELKTIQTLDELDISKPCIDVQDEGYNVEWSQELKVYESFDEYLRAWVLIHALHHKFGWHGERPGVVFNMSVGYNLEGMQKPNVQWFFDSMADASEYLPDYIDIVANRYPEVRDLDISTQMSDTITLSTMHGCPPDEIEKISLYLLEERGLHTSVKCNPTLIGPDRVRTILNDDLGFDDVPVPDEAFGHDLKYVDAVPMLHNLRRVANSRELTFGVKLSNTLEVENWRTVFEGADMMYLSGRPLHAITANLASMLSEEFRGDLMMSFAGGADCFNVADLIRSGTKTITVCSDLLKHGGYLRMLQYMENLDAAMDEVSAVDTTDFIAKSATRQASFEWFGLSLWNAATNDSGLDMSREQCDSLQATLTPDVGDRPMVEVIDEWAIGAGFDEERAAIIVDLAVKALTRVNLRQYGQDVRKDWRYNKQSFRMDRSKTQRSLEHFDCIEAPCTDECPVNQKVPHYMSAVRDGDFAAAIELVREDNPVPTILGRVCDHLCENTCIRTHLDQPLAIRHMKRFIMSHEGQPVMIGEKPDATPGRVAIIGAGPAGIAAAQSLAYAGFDVTVFEAHAYSGGMTGGAIPSYRLPRSEIDQDVAILEELGVEIRYGHKAGVDFTIEDLRSDGYSDVIVAVGAQLAKQLNLPGEEAEGIVDGIAFLRSVREGNPMQIGPRVGVVGAGDTAMDCIRSANRVGENEVSLIYRRTIDQMPADPEEIHASIDEGIDIVELAVPSALKVEDGRLTTLVCARTEYRGERDSSGRRIPFNVPDSDFDIELDTLLLAISQQSVLDFFGDDVPELTRWGSIDVDPDTHESSIPGIYAGGDVAAGGPSSVVKAAADGKRIAAAIIAKHAGDGAAVAGPAPAAVDVQEMMLRRARREYRTEIQFSPLDQRDGFDETVLAYTPEEAMAEASRCLGCHEICSLCVGVCPNMALMTYEMDPADSTVASQNLQIAVLTDFCNECGNCETACPTSGSPYKDKPRLYLDRGDFEAQNDNAFMVLGSSTIEARKGGSTHRLELNGQTQFDSELEATMATLLRGMTGSMAHVPAYTDGGTYVTHPGYSED